MRLWYALVAAATVACAQTSALIESAARATDDAQRRIYYAKAQQVTSADVPSVPLWYRVNVAESESALRGVSLSPTADFTFLNNVTRVSAPQ